MFRFLVGLALAAAAAFSQAAGLDRLNEFMNQTRAARAEFTQRLVDRQGKVVQESRGSLEFSRPGRFRWVYAKPYNQVIVGDGTRVWIHDPDLNQVTVRKLDVALGSTPAALLAGNNEAVQAFNLTEEGTRDGLEWVRAVPKDKEASFESIRMGFGPDGLASMELVDTFGQRTQLSFSRFARNPRLDPALFKFTPPAGADVIGE